MEMDRSTAELVLATVERLLRLRRDEPARKDIVGERVLFAVVRESWLAVVKS